MHIRNHKDDCQYRYSFAYTDCVGDTCGEGIETSWSEGNQTGGSTKKQNKGHRHDELDKFHGHWNWEKVIKLGGLVGLAVIHVHLKSLGKHTRCIGSISEPEQNCSSFTTSLKH
jgi:hypothetical protein